MEKAVQLNEEVKIEESKLEENGISVRVSDDKMKAYLIMERPNEGERRTEADLMAVLTKVGVNRGIDKEILQKMLKEEYYYRECIVATGRDVVNGVDGEYIFHFRTEKLGKPVVLEDGSIDYRNAELFERVTKGQLLVEYTPATAGSFGYTVTGQLLIPKRGKDLSVIKGKGFELSEDKKKYTSLMDGKIDYSDLENKMEISSYFLIHGDLDMTRGNIRFGGDVEITGDVEPNMVIEAAGNIVIGGHVSTASLTAGGDILLKKGMQGSGRGFVKAGGNISGKFFENTLLECKGNVDANYLLSCELHAEGSVTISGLHGMIVGGVTRAVKGVTAQSLGNRAELATVIEVGINREMSSRYTELKKTLSKLDSELKIFTEGMEKLGVVSDLSAKNQLMYQRAKQAVAMKEEEKEGYLQEYRKLTEVIFATKNIKVVVTGMVYPGAKIVIDMEELTLKNWVRNVYFKKKDGKIAIIQNEY